MFKMITYGAKYRTKPPADKYIDVRHLKNPYAVAGLRNMTGKQIAVRNFVKSDPNYLEVKLKVLRALTEGQTVAVYCMGGKHRSVSVVEDIRSELEGAGHAVQVTHMELDCN